MSVEWDHDAAQADLIRMLTETRDLPGKVVLPRLAVNMLLDKIAELTPRTVATAEELRSLPEGAMVIDREGDVSQKRGGLWCGYETAPLNSNRLARLGSPFTVLNEGAGT